jgi:hypothetical protein
MELRISIDSEETLSGELKKLLEEKIDQDNQHIALELIRREKVYRGLDPTVLVAIVTVVGTGLGVLITGILEVAKQKSAGKIVIQSKGGSRIEVPASISPDKLDWLVEKVKKLESESIEILLP